MQDAFCPRTDVQHDHRHSVRVPFNELDSQVKSKIASDAKSVAGCAYGCGGGHVLRRGRTYSNNFRQFVMPTEALGWRFALIALLMMFGSLVAAVLPLFTAGRCGGVGVRYHLHNDLVVPPSRPRHRCGSGVPRGARLRRLFLISRHRDQLSDGLEVESHYPFIATAVRQ